MKAIYGVLGHITNEEANTMGVRLAHRGKIQTIERISNRLFLGCMNLDTHNNVFIKNRYAIVADATLYNRRELQEFLSSSGYQLNTDSNEELILALYQLNEIDGIGKINGDFAFAIWDDKKKELILGRDFFGCHPLYYTSLPGNGLAFSSEYKALLSLEEVPAIPNLDMIQHLQNCKKLPIGRTLLKNVNAVEAGSLLTFDSNGNQLGQQHIPKLTLDIQSYSEGEATQKVREALKSAIQYRVDNQEKIGIALSGGIDSIGVACICCTLYPEREIHTFTAGCGEDDSDLHTASKVAQAMNTIHHEIMTPPDLLTHSLNKLVWHLEDPYARSESLQLYQVARLASRFVPFLLCAQGSDGLFAGMPKHKILWYMKKAQILKQPLEEFYNLTQLAIKPKSFLGRAMDTLYFRGKVPEVPTVIGTDYTPEVYQFPPMNKEFINMMLVKGYQGGVCQSVHKFESSFAAWGVDYVSPFYDRNLIQTAYRIPDSLKIKDGKQKYILRRALRSIVPDEFLNVPKLPQRMKYNLDFSNTLDEVSDKYLSRDKVEKRGFFDFSDIQRLKKRKPGTPYSDEGAMRIWTALLTEIWAIEFLDKKGSGPESS